MINWSNGDFHSRKQERKEYYERFVYGWKLKKCTACMGSGIYDSHGSPTCGACDGTGKERYKPKFGLYGTIIKNGQIHLLATFDSKEMTQKYVEKSLIKDEFEETSDSNKKFKKNHCLLVALII